MGGGGVDGGDGGPGQAGSVVVLLLLSLLLLSLLLLLLNAAMKRNTHGSQPKDRWGSTRTAAMVPGALRKRGHHDPNTRKSPCLVESTGGRRCVGCPSRGRCPPDS
jgi:hypothetical protein